MTCIIGMIEGGETYIGADGYATSEECELKPIICRKLFKSGRYIVAFAGHIRTGQLLYPESGFEFPDEIYQIPNKMYLWLREFEAIGRDEIQMGVIASNFIIATEDNIYEIYTDMQISEINKKYGYTAMGSGSPYALGSLYTTSNSGYRQKKMAPKDRIKLSLEAANRFVKNCGEPYQIFSYKEAMKKLKSKPYIPECTD